MCDELDLDLPLPLPKDWTNSVRSYVLNIIAILRIAMLNARGLLIQDGDAPLANKHQLGSEIAMLRQELRLVGARMERIPPHRRPQYTPTERMAILELRAMRGWNKAETARRFHVTDDTIRAWLRRADDDTLLQTFTPVNRFPDLVRYIVQQIKLFCPMLGKVKIAQKLARVSIHLGKTTVGRILKEEPAKEPEPGSDSAKQCRIVSKYPSHTCHADLTAVPISGGFWTVWIPNALCQRWPVCWWVLNVVDHFSRRSIGFAVFKSKPSSKKTTDALTRIMFKERIRPKHLIVDQGKQFKCEDFEDWCEAMAILPRFGAVNKHGSIAVVERFHRTMKEYLRQIVVPEDQAEFERELSLIIHWYNEHRPHDTLGGKTPNEVYFSRPPANEQPRLEPRARWPRGSPCAAPLADVGGNPGDWFVVELDRLEGRRHLPILRAKRAA